MKTTRLCYILSVIAVLNLISGLFCTRRFVGFSPLTVLDGETCIENDVINVTQLNNKKKCFIMCSQQPSCYGLFLGPDQRCVTCATRFFTKDNIQTTCAMSKFYKRLSWSSANTSGVSVFHVVKQRSYWNVSKQNCEDVGGCLARIRSEEENEYVVNTVLASNNVHVWIGGNGTNESEDTFTWLDGSKVADGYTNWANGQPYHPYEGTVCILMYSDENYQWADNFCNTTYYGLCKFE